MPAGAGNPPNIKMEPREGGGGGGRFNIRGKGLIPGKLSLSKEERRARAGGWAVLGWAGAWLGGQP